MFSWWVKFAEKFTRNIQDGCVYIGSGPINVKIKNLYDIRKNLAWLAYDNA